MDGQTPDANARLSRLSRETPAFYRWRVPDGVQARAWSWVPFYFFYNWVESSGYGFFVVETPGIKLAPNFSLKTFKQLAASSWTHPYYFR